MIPRAIVVVSDTHCGCQFGLCPPEGCPEDGGGLYLPSQNQRTVWGWWEQCWKEWIPIVTRGEPFILVHNGDVIEGVVRRATTPITHNLKDQEELAYRVMAPKVALASSYFHVRGTEAHVGKSATEEERVAARLGAVKHPRSTMHAHYVLRIRLHGYLVHFTHHIGTTASIVYEATAVGKEQAEAFHEAGRWGIEPPQVLIRSHRHRHYETREIGEKGVYISTVTPGWQLKTPFVYQRGNKSSVPQFGIVVVRIEDDGLVNTHVWGRGIKPEPAFEFNADGTVGVE